MRFTILISLVLTTLTVGCEKLNPGWCGLRPEGCTDAGPIDAAVDTPTDGVPDASPLQASIAECHRKVAPAPDDGITIDRPVEILCTAIARQCSAMVTPTTVQSPMPQPFSLSFAPTGQLNEWAGSFLPALGGNDVKVTCQGDPETADATTPLLPILAMSFTLEGGVEVLGPGRYRYLGGNVTWRWNVPGANACSAVATVNGVPAPQYGFSGALPGCQGSHGPFPISGPANPVTYTVTGSPGGFRGSVLIEI